MGCVGIRPFQPRIPPWLLVLGSSDDCTPAGSVVGLTSEYYLPSTLAHVPHDLQLVSGAALCDLVPLSTVAPVVVSLAAEDLDGLVSADLVGLRGYVRAIDVRALAGGGDIARWRVVGDLVERLQPVDVVGHHVWAAEWAPPGKYHTAVLRRAVSVPPALLSCGELWNRVLERDDGLLRSLQERVQRRMAEERGVEVPTGQAIDLYGLTLADVSHALFEDQAPVRLGSWGQWPAGWLSDSFMNCFLNLLVSGVAVQTQTYFIESLVFERVRRAHAEKSKFQTWARSIRTVDDMEARLAREFKIVEDPENPSVRDESERARHRARELLRSLCSTDVREASRSRLPWPARGAPSWEEEWREATRHVRNARKRARSRPGVVHCTPRASDLVAASSGDGVLLVPIHMAKGHWILGVVRWGSLEIVFYDSMRSRTGRYRPMFDALVALLVDVANIDEDAPWSLKVPDVAQQGNFSDCGVYTLNFARYVAFGLAVPLLLPAPSGRCGPLAPLRGALLVQLLGGRPLRPHIQYVEISSDEDDGAT